jgi:hypothetical protein
MFSISKILLVVWAVSSMPAYSVTSDMYKKGEALEAALLKKFPNSSFAVAHRAYEAAIMDLNAVPRTGSQDSKVEHLYYTAVAKDLCTWANRIVYSGETLLRTEGAKQALRAVREVRLTEMASVYKELGDDGSKYTTGYRESLYCALRNKGL